MRKVDLGQAITTLANLGVIAGIIFLGMELRQNNQFLAAEARSELITQRSAAFEANLDPFVLEAIHKYAAGEPVTPVETSAALMMGMKFLELWEWQYGEYAAGMLELEQLPVEAWRIWFNSQGEVPTPVRDVWEQRKRALHPGFVQFMEEHVVNR